GLARPGQPAIEPNAVIELFGIAEYQARRDADVLHQGSGVELLGVDPRRQTDPEDEPAVGPGHLAALGEVTLHGQLEGAEILPVLVTDVTQMAVITAVLQIGGDPHLRHAAGRVGTEGLQSLDLLTVAPGQDPADTHSR